MDIDNTAVSDYLLEELNSVDKQNFTNDFFKYAITSKNTLGIKYTWEFTNGYGVSMIEFFTEYKEMYQNKYELALIEFDSCGNNSVEDVFQTSSMDEVKEFLEDVKMKSSNKEESSEWEEMIGGRGNKKFFIFNNRSDIIDYNSQNKDKNQQEETLKRDFSEYEMGLKNDFNSSNINSNNNYLALSILDGLKVKAISAIMYYISNDYLYDVFEQKLFNIRGKYIN